MCARATGQEIEEARESVASELAALEAIYDTRFQQTTGSWDPRKVVVR
jgi:hypothetical protein